MRRPELVPLPAPAEDEIAGHVGEVGDRAVRVAARVRGLAAPVRLDALADLAVGVGGAARLQVALLRHVPVRGLPVRDPLAADHAGEADVDHAPRRLDVQADAEAREEDGGRGEQPRRARRAAPTRGGRSRRAIQTQRQRR